MYKLILEMSPNCSMNENTVDHFAGPASIHAVMEVVMLAPSISRLAPLPSGM